MKPRWLIYTSFLAFVTVISIFRRPHLEPPKATWLAMVDLPSNTRVETNNVRKPDFPTPAASWSLPSSELIFGRYTLTDIKQGNEVAVTNLSASPHVPERAGTSLISLGIQDFGELAMQLNAGAKIYVCDPDTTNIFGPYPIEAVFGKSGGETSLIRVTNSEARALQKIAKPQLRLAGLP